MSKVEPMKSDDLDWWVDFVPDAAIVVGQDQVVLAANGRANALFGAQECGLKGKSLELLIPEALRRSHRRHVKNFFSKDQCRAMGSGLRLQGRRLDGRLLPVDIMLNQFCIGDKHISMAVIRDDSDRVAICRMKDELEASNARLSRAQAVGGLGWWELDHESDQLTWSSMVPVILGLPVEAEPSFELIATLCLDEDGPHLLVKDRAGKDIVGKRLTYKIVRPDGGIRWVEETVDSVSDGRVLGVMRDITTEKTLEETLRKESTIDDLTGLYNRRQFNRDLRVGFQERSRRSHNRWVIMYDFDHFKKINDTHGHIIGDRVLYKAAHIVVSQLRPSDYAYRLGGEEFAVMVHDASVNDVQSIAERIRHAIEWDKFKVDEYSLPHVTVSLGFSRVRGSDTHFEDVLLRADEALYLSKSSSRNTISHR